MYDDLIVYKYVAMIFDKERQLLISVEEQDIHAISHNEKSGIQAIATVAPDLNPTTEHGAIKRDPLLAGIDFVTGEATVLLWDSYKSKDFINSRDNYIDPA